jgi:hypothetical protein
MQGPVISAVDLRVGLASPNHFNAQNNRPTIPVPDEGMWFTHPANGPT